MTEPYFIQYHLKRLFQNLKKSEQFFYDSILRPTLLFLFTIKNLSFFNKNKISIMNKNNIFIEAAYEF